MGKLQSAATTLGRLSNVEARDDQMPPGRRLIVTGEVTAPTPCHKATLVQSDEISIPETLVLKVVVTRSSGACIDVLTDVPFRFVDEDYKGGIKTVVVRSDDDEVSATVKTTS